MFKTMNTLNSLNTQLVFNFIFYTLLFPELLLSTIDLLNLISNLWHN